MNESENFLFYFILFNLAIRSGDYYMFNYESEDEEEEEIQDEATVAQEQVLLLKETSFKIFAFLLWLDF